MKAPLMSLVIGLLASIYAYSPSTAARTKDPYIRLSCPCTNSDCAYNSCKTQCGCDYVWLLQCLKTYSTYISCKTESPTEAPFAWLPTAVPTEAPTGKPTAVPTEAPTGKPTEIPTTYYSYKYYYYAN